MAVLRFVLTAKNAVSNPAGAPNRILLQARYLIRISINIKKTFYAPLAIC